MFCFLRYADDVEEGDEVLTIINDKMVPAEVIKMTRAMLEGKYKFLKKMKYKFNTSHRAYLNKGLV